MATCKQCNAVVPEQKAFCPECGAPTAQQAAERRTPTHDLGATVLVPPSQWPSLPKVGDAQPPKPTSTPVAQPTVAPPPPTSPAASPAPAVPRMEVPPPTTSPVVAPPKKSNWLVFLLGGAVVLLLVLLAFLLLNRG